MGVVNEIGGRKWSGHFNNPPLYDGVIDIRIILGQKVIRKLPCMLRFPEALVASPNPGSPSVLSKLVNR